MNKHYRRDEAAWNAVQQSVEIRYFRSVIFRLHLQYTIDMRATKGWETDDDDTISRQLLQFDDELSA